MNKIFPHPFLSLFVILMWLLLSDFTLGQSFLGFIVSVISGVSMARLHPEKVFICNWHLFPKLFFRLLIDITCSNLLVVYIILTGRRSKNHLGFMVIPLKLKSRTGLAILACILTATPGTAWISYDSKNSYLTLHVLDLVDETYWSNLIKNRYENLLLEIFK